MPVAVDQAPVTERKVVVVFVGGGKVRADELLVAALTGLKHEDMIVLQYDHTSALMDGAKSLAKDGIKIDLLVYLTYCSMSHGNATVIREHVGAAALLHLWRTAPFLVVSVVKNIATLQVTKGSKRSMLRKIFTLAATSGEWPSELKAI